jgi:hypothetical protein
MPAGLMRIGKYPSASCSSARRIFRLERRRPPRRRGWRRDGKHARNLGGEICASRGKGCRTWSRSFPPASRGATRRQAVPRKRLTDGCLHTARGSRKRDALPIRRRTPCSAAIDIFNGPQTARLLLLRLIGHRRSSSSLPSSCSTRKGPRSPGPAGGEGANRRMPDSGSGRGVRPRTAFLGNPPFEFRCMNSARAMWYRPSYAAFRLRWRSSFRRRPAHGAFAITFVNNARPWKHLMHAAPRRGHFAESPDGTHQAILCSVCTTGTPSARAA